jgi:hypothetical protein
MQPTYGNPYGDPGYRRRYGARIDYYTPYAYAGVGQLPMAGHVQHQQLAGTGYGAPIGQGYGAPMTAYGTAMVPYHGLFDKDRDKDSERKPFWNTIGDAVLIGAAAVGGSLLVVATAGAVLPVGALIAGGTTLATGLTIGGGVVGAGVGAGLAGRRKKAALAAESAGVKLDLARKRKLGWQELATSSAVGAGNIGTAAATAPVEALTMVPGGVDPNALAAYDTTATSMGLYGVIAIMGIGLLGVLGWAFTRGSGRRVA